MSQNVEQTPCPICGENYVKQRRQDDVNVYQYECERCGSFEISRVDVGYSQSKECPWRESRHLISAWIRRENISGVTPFIGKGVIMKDWIEQLKHAGFPETTNEKLNALLLMYADNTKGNYQARILSNSDQPELIAKIGAKNIDEVRGLTRFLEEMDYIGKIGGVHGSLRITAKGWFHVDELRKISADSNSAFVAMWFHDTTKEYREAVVAATQYCNYKPIILDQEEYNGFIMEQVVSQIKQARFIVADFTCRPESIEENGKIKAGVRGGVYWEAGLAYGLGKPVIHTCEDNEDAKNRRHFDIDQYNTIFWKSNDLDTNIRNLSEKIDNPTFAERLASRILFVVGIGSYKEQ
jgi:nucleoside 2-deoxyribosyltransferase/predicted RNA-binding Zn-ribbon protein involved in translation (DUF1610 family)